MEFNENDFLDIVCPKCGGTIVLSEDKTHGICPYCVSEYLLTEEELVKAENEAGIEREISGVHLREISRNTLDDYIFQRMDDETSRKYIRYRYRKIISTKLYFYISILVVDFLALLLGYYGTAGCSFGDEWIIIAAAFLSAVWIILIAIPRLYHMTKDIYEAKGYCEYTYAIVDFTKEMKFICSDGRRLTYKMKELIEDEAGDGDAVFLVHVPSIGKVFIEDIGTMKRKFALSELRKGIKMVLNSLLYCAAIGIVMIAGPYIMFSKQAVKEYVTAGKRKHFDKILILFFLCFIIWFDILKIPQVVNQLYETRSVTVKEITGESPLGGVLEIKTQRFMKDTKVKAYCASVHESKMEIIGIHAENLKPNDKIEIRKFANASIVTRKNGKETAFYKKYYEEWLSNPVWDRIILTLAVFINILLHGFRFGNKVKNNLGCAVFSMVMLACVWKPIGTMQDAYRWGCLLSVLFIGYQILDFIWCIRNPEYYNIPYPKLKGKYFKIEEEEKVDILTQRKHIDYVCPNCGGKMVTTEDHKYKKCFYCESVIPLSEDERDDVNEILHVLDIPTADCAQVVRKICMRYRTKADYDYLAGANLTLTDPEICREVKKNLQIPAGEKMYFIYDYGWLTSLKFGLAICKTGIYFRNSRFKKRGKYSWEEFKKIQIFADDSMLNLGRVKFYEAECQALGELLLKIQKEI